MMSVCSYTSYLLYPDDSSMARAKKIIYNVHSLSIDIINDLNEVCWIVFLVQ
jgi:hypothetical protein